jgi:hypothetical protein
MSVKDLGYIEGAYAETYVADSLDRCEVLVLRVTLGKCGRSLAGDS